MNKIKRWLSGWLTALFAVVLTLASVTGCGSGVDGELIAELGMAALEEYAAAELSESSIDDQQNIVQWSDDQQGNIDESLAQAGESSKQNEENKTEAEVNLETEGEETEEIQSETPGEEKQPEQQIEEPETQSESETQSQEIETEPQIDENGSYTSKEDVALYLHIYGKLPSNFITKNEAEDLGWKQKQGEAGQLHVAAPGKSIGGSKFGNYEGLLPKAKGRQYYECDINYVKGNRGAERIVYSNDGLIFYTGDHYETFEQLYPKE